MSLLCRLEGCGFKAHSLQQRSAHERWHVTRNEAVRGADGESLIPTGVVIPHKAPKNGKHTLVCNICNRTFGNEHGLKTHYSRVHGPNAINPPSTSIAPAPVGETFDISTLSESQLASIRQQLGIATVEPVQVEDAPHSCSTTRGLDMMKRAVVLVSLAEMVEEMPDPNQLLQMVGTMKNMPMMTHGNNGKRAR